MVVMETDALPASDVANMRLRQNTTTIAFILKINLRKKKEQ